MTSTGFGLRPKPLLTTAGETMFTTKPLSTDEQNYVTEVMSALGAASDESRVAAAAYIEGLASKGLPVIFDQQHLSHITGVRSQTIGLIRADAESFDPFFWLPKRAGGSRRIAAPTPVLRRLQDFVHFYITSQLGQHWRANGFVRVVPSFRTPPHTAVSQ